MTGLLIFAWGNPSRGDDALGPLLAERLQALVHAQQIEARVEVLTDFQLQVEHALDLVGREHVLFIDASMSASAPFEVTPVHAARDASFTTHAMSPEAVLQVYEQLHGQAPPPCSLLALRGERFELGEPLSANALVHLDAAVAWCAQWIKDTTPCTS